MPASYTHYMFGQAVYNKLSKELKDVIDKNKPVYNIGLSGPDIFFYYKPLSKNHVNSIGHDMHREDATHFFKEAKERINKYELEEGIPYILGFICHFILDSNCHPYIAKAMEENGLSHCEIEAELDGRVMRSNNESPQKISAGKHIVASKECSKVISQFYDGIDSGEIYKALKSVRFYNEILLCQNNLKRNVVKGILENIKGAKSFSDMIINVVPNPKAKKIIDELIRLYEISIYEAVQIIEEYYYGLNNKSSINERFNRNFG